MRQHIVISRRDFLARTALAGAGATLAPLLKPTLATAARSVPVATTTTTGAAFGQTSFKYALTHFDRTEFLSDQTSLRRPIKLTHTLYNFFDAPGPDEAWLLSKGTIPIVNAFGRIDNSDYPGNSAISAGKYDTQIKAWAKSLGALNGTVFVRPLREMNGSWAPWFTTDYASYIKAWRHIRGLFSAFPNCKFVWCPATSGSVYNPWYPGDAFVDICGIDGYCDIKNWRSFHDIFAPFYALCNSQTGTLCKKPTMVCETNAEVSSNQVTYNRGAYWAGVVPTLKSSFPLLGNLCVWVDQTYPDFGVAGSNQYIAMANLGW